MEDKIFINDLKHRLFLFWVLCKRTNEVPEGGKSL